MTGKTLNLDMLAAETAQAIVGEVKQNTDKAKVLYRLASKALGVLQEHGLYALMLFLFSRSGEEATMANVIRSKLHQALTKLPGFQGTDVPDGLNQALDFYINQVLGNLDTLLLVRDLYEQTLIYAYYGAKAAGG